MFLNNINYKKIAATTITYGIIGSLAISSAIGMVFFDGHGYLGLEQKTVNPNKVSKKKTKLRLEQVSQMPVQEAKTSNEINQAVNISYSNTQPNNSNYNVKPVVKATTAPTSPIPEKDYPMLARIIHAEAGGESLRGQVAVGAVLINRINSGKFPRSLNANIFKPGEFESVSNGYIWSNPTPESYKAARLAMDGWDPTYGALYFFNPAKSTSRWIWTRKVNIIIGEHHFAG